MSTPLSHFRRAAAAALAVSSLVVVTSCAAQAPEKDSGEPIPITFWDQKGGDASAVLDDLVAEYNDSQQEYRLERQFIAGSADQFASQIQNAIRTDETPNLVFGDSNASRIGTLLESDRVLDLEPYFGTGDHPVEKEDIYPGMLEPSTFGDTVYSLPTDGGAYTLIYNTKAFDDAGITRLPETWKDIAKTARTLTSGGKYGIYLPIGGSEWTSFTWQSMLWSAGGEFLDAQNTSAEFDSPAGVEALTTWTDLVKDGVAFPSSLDDDTQQTGITGFIAGQVQMFIGRPGDLATVDAALGEGVAEALPFPRIKEAAMNTGTNVSYILDGSKAENDGAWAFLSWVLQPEQQAKWDIGTGYLPTNQKTMDNPAWKKHVASDPRITVFTEQLTHARTRPAIPQYGAVSSALAAQIELAMLQQISPEDALRAAAAEADEILQEQK